MKLVSYARNNRNSFGAVVDGHVVDLQAALPAYPDLLGFLEHASPRDWDRAREAGTPACALDEIQLLPPVPNARKIFGVGVNFESHARETGRKVGAEPILFLRLADAQVGAGEPIRVPHDNSSFECEGELAVVIGKRARHVSPENALGHVAGYSCFVDGSARAWQLRTNAVTGKNFYKSGSFGPWLQTADEVDPADLLIETRINRCLVQSGRTREMAFSIPRLISYISGFTPLLPGDVLVTGTPGRVGAEVSLSLRPGDEVSVTIASVGTLRNPVTVDA